MTNDPWTDKAPEQQEDFSRGRPSPQTRDYTFHRTSYVVDAPARSRSREIREWIISLAVAVVLGLILHFLVFQLVRVEGTSMLNTLDNNYIVFSTPATYIFRAPVRGEIVITKYPARPGEHFVKRVIGLPGEIIEIRDGLVYINGNPLNEPYTKDAYIEYEMEATVVPKNFIFVLGDNRNNSNDSHSLSVGPLPMSYLQGKAHCILYPFHEIGALELPVY